MRSTRPLRNALSNSQCASLRRHASCVRPPGREKLSSSARCWSAWARRVEDDGRLGDTVDLGDMNGVLQRPHSRFTTSEICEISKPQQCIACRKTRPWRFESTKPAIVSIAAYAMPAVSTGQKDPDVDICRQIHHPCLIAPGLPQAKSSGRLAPHFMGVLCTRFAKQQSPVLFTLATATRWRRVLAACWLTRPHTIPSQQSHPRR